MGAVYQARDQELDRIIALKVIRPELAANPSILARFKQELILSRNVTHKNVVRIFDLGEAEGTKFITMEYVEGEDLRGILRRKGKFHSKEAVVVIQQICRALEAAHAEGVIHRDLKPQNVMRDPQGRVVVMDFGLARSLESEGMTQTGALVGTLEYMSPEQALGGSLDQRSDLFAVGLIFYELLTGKAPYKADTAIASLMKRTHERAIPASDVDASVAGFAERDRKPLPGARSEREVSERVRLAEGARCLEQRSGPCGDFEVRDCLLHTFRARAGIDGVRAAECANLAEPAGAARMDVGCCRPGGGGSVFCHPGNAASGISPFRRECEHGRGRGYPRLE